MKEHLLKYIAIASLYLAPIHTMMLLIGAFIIIDTVAGRWAAWKIAVREGKEPRLVVTSRKTRQGFLAKVIVYQTALILLFILDKYMLNDIVTYFFADFPIKFLVTKILGVVLILIEFDSIDEKVYRVKGTRVSTVVISKLKILRNMFKEVKSSTSDNTNSSV